MDATKLESSGQGHAISKFEVCLDFMEGNHE